MLKKLKYIFIILMVYLVFLVILFPADIAIKYAKDAKVIPQGISLHRASGSVWTGVLHRVSYQHIELENVRWSISPLALLTGKLNAALIIGDKHSEIKADGDISINNEGLSVTDFTARAAIETFTKNMPLPYGLKAEGQVQANIDYFTQGKPWCDSLKATVTTNETVLRSPFGKLDVEQFSSVLTCPKGIITVATQPDKNSLGINGTVSLNKSKNYTLQATVKPPVDAPRDYINLLKFSGKPNNQGQYSFKLNGRL